MMLFKPLVSFLLTVLAAAAAQKVTLTLTPALDFHDAVEDDGDVLLFRIVMPNATDSCKPRCRKFDPTNIMTDAYCPIVCSGTFPLDLSLYNEIEFSFEAPEGKEITIVSGQESRVRIEFQAVADSCANGFAEVGAFTPEIIGSNVAALTANYNPSESFVEIGKCSECSSCEIFTRVELSTDGTSFSGLVSKISWSVPYNNSVFAGASEVDYTYDTQGYSGIRTPFEGALGVDVPTASPSPTRVPTRATLSSAPSSVPSETSPDPTFSLNPTASLSPMVSFNPTASLSPTATQSPSALPSVLPVFSTKTKLRLRLIPALDFHEELDDYDDVLLFRLNLPQVTNSCEERCSEFDPTDCPTVCGATFPLDLSLHNEIEFSFEAPEGQEIRIVSGEEYRVRIEFQIVADSCDLDGFVDFRGEAFTPEITGSNVVALTANYNPSESFVEIGKCSECTSCEIFTRIEFSTIETSFSGLVSKISWSVTYDSFVFSSAGDADYTYGTVGHIWIRTPVEGALVPAQSPLGALPEASRAGSLQSFAACVLTTAFALMLTN